MSKSSLRLTRPPGAGLDPNLQAIYENLEILNGARGDGLDRSVLMRDLIDLGYITAKKGAGGKLVPTKPGGEGTTLPGQLPVEAPTLPQNVIASGGFSNILIEWDAPTYSGHSYTQILRADADNFSTASPIATTAANLYSDSVGAGKEYFYWVRFVNKADIVGPIQSTQGVKGKTEADIGDILDKLKGQIDESFLTPEFDSRINDYGNGISKNESGIVTLEGEVSDVKTETEVLSISAEITAEGLADVAKGRDEEGNARRGIVATVQKDQKVLFTKAGAMAQSIQEVSVRVGDNAASIVDTKTSIVKLDEKTGKALSVVTERLDKQSSNIGDISAKVTTNTTTIAKVDNKTDANSGEIHRVETSITARMDRMTSSIGSNSSSITRNEQTLVEVGRDINSVSQRLTTLSSTVGGVSSSVSQNAQTIATINANGTSAYKALWGVKASIGDIVAGIGLTVKRETGKPPVSQCTVIADQFSVGSLADGKTVYPFIVTSKGVFIDTAYIKAAKIQDLVAGAVVADTVKATATLTAPVIKGGKINIGNNFSVDENGNMRAANANISGHINATSGTFTGTLRGADGTFTGTVEARKIVGDVASVRTYPVSSFDDDGTQNPRHTLFTFRIASPLRDDVNVQVSGITAYSKAYNQATTLACRVKKGASVYLDAIIAAYSSSVSNISTGGFYTVNAAAATNAVTPWFKIPRGVYGTFTVELYGFQSTGMRVERTVAGVTIAMPSRTLS